MPVDYVYAIVGVLVWLLAVLLNALHQSGNESYKLEYSLKITKQDYSLQLQMNEKLERWLVDKNIVITELSAEVRKRTYKVDDMVRIERSVYDIITLHVQHEEDAYMAQHRLHSYNMSEEKYMKLLKEQLMRDVGYKLENAFEWIIETNYRPRGYPMFKLTGRLRYLIAKD